MKLTKEKTMPVIMEALKEDIGSGDITTSLVFESDKNVMADIFVNEDCVAAGIDIVKWIFNSLDERIIFRPLCRDGDRAKKGKKVISLSGSLKCILTGERAALNFLGRLSGIATLTSKFVDKVKGTKAQVFDTRKTTPGLRVLEKYAVSAGGGFNHRMGLWDGVLVKDNHVSATSDKRQATRERVIKDIVSKIKHKGYKNVEIEVENMGEFKAALEAGADIIMLDNMRMEDIRRAVKLRETRDKRQETRSFIEVSGGVSLENVSKLARTGADRISVGSLTHSAPSIDFSLEICQ